MNFDKKKKKIDNIDFDNVGDIIFHLMSAASHAARHGLDTFSNMPR